MESNDLPQLTPAELEVMKVLWAGDSLSAREIHEQLAERLGWAYSTTRTTVERMVR
jgi:predicted transcriptional regulator